MSRDFFVRQSKSDPKEWIVWGPMGNPEFIGRYSGHSTPGGARKEADFRENLRRDVTGLAQRLVRNRLSVDLTLKCPTCGKRADMCFAHGDDWKKR